MFSRTSCLLSILYLTYSATAYSEDAWTYSNGDKLDSQGTLQGSASGHYDNGPWCENLQVLSNYTRAFPDTFWRISDGFVCSPADGAQQCLIPSGGYNELSPRYSQTPAPFHDTSATDGDFYWDADGRFASTIYETQGVYVPAFRDLLAAVANVSFPVPANTTGYVYFVNTWHCVRGIVSGCPPQSLGIPFSNGTVGELCAPMFEEDRIMNGPATGADIFIGARAINRTTADMARSLGVSPHQYIPDGGLPTAGLGVKAAAQWQTAIVASLVVCILLV